MKHTTHYDYSIIKSELIKELIIIIFLFVLGVIVTTYLTKDDYHQTQNERTLIILFGGYAFAACKYGWPIINNIKILPNIKLIMSMRNWLFVMILYFSFVFPIKLFFAIFIGYFIVPYRIYIIIKGIISSR